MTKQNPITKSVRALHCALTGALLTWSASSLWAQQTPPPAATPPNATESPDDEEVVTMSPFVVSSQEDSGYYASHTLSGTRMNTRLRDLGASISVITPQQLIDTASVDINDVFQYEANTEGTHTYTEFGLDRGSISTTSVQQSPQTANRVRGIGRPDRAVDYFISLDQIPMDAYNIDRLTINRGPNSVLFGLGSAAGLVNSSPAQANLGQETRHLEFRLGSWDDFRTSFNVNQTLIDGTLAVRLAGLYHDRGFRQQPSHDYTRRGYLATTFQPLPRTTLRASYERYSSDYRRPNANTPQDFISTWEAAGRPTFNPSTMMVRASDGTLHPVAISSTNNFAATVNNLSNNGLGGHPHNTRAAFLIENNQVHSRIQRQLGNTVGGSNLVEQVAASAGPQFPSAIFTTPGINRKELYDWDRINILSGNFGEDRADTYQFTVEQQIGDRLFLEFGWRREEFERFSIAAQSGNQAGIYVDVNETQLDGTPNPFFLSPYIEVWEPTGSTSLIDNETMRGTAVYELDFSRSDSGLLRLLGRHNLMGLAEDRRIENNGYRWREAVISTHEWAPAVDANGNPINKSTGSNYRTRQNRVYYLGTNGRVTHSPGDSLFGAIPRPGRDYPEGVIGEPFPQTLRHFVPTMVDDGEGGLVWVGRDGSTDYGVPGGRPIGTWVDEQAITATILHDTAPPTQQTKIRSFAGVVQSYWWDDRIVTTFGWRKDKREFRQAENPFINDEGFRENIGEANRTFEDPWDEVSGSTRTKGVVVHPLLHWDRAPQWMRGISLHYNESDTFQPAAFEQDLFLRTLPVPIGEGKDYGFSVELLEGKLITRVNWFEAAEAFSRVSAGLVTGRARRVENEGGWGFVDMIEREIELREPGLALGDLNAFEIGDPVTAPYLEEISERSGLPVEWLHTTRGFNDNRTVQSEGMEISLDYNPSRNWNFKFTAGRQEAVNSDVAPAAQEWLFGNGSFEAPEAGSRLDLWQAAMFSEPTASETGVVGTQVPWWTTNWAGMPSWGLTPQSWYAGVVESLLRQDIRLQGLSNPQVREWRWSFITNYRFTDGPLRGLGLGGSMRWEDKAAIGYMGMENPVTGVVELYDVDSPIWDEAREYYDFWASYTTRLFDDSIRLRVQLNVRNAFEDGGLQVFAANPDGRPAGFRIREPRTFFLTTAFDF